MKKTVKDTLKKVLQKDKYKNLSKEEIIVVSIVTGTLLALLLGYVFGETQYLTDDGERIYSDLKTIRKEYGYIHIYINYAFNYFIGISSFIIFSGISFLYLNRSKTNTENIKVENAKENPEHQRVVEGLTKAIQSAVDTSKENNLSLKDFSFKGFIGNMINDHGATKVDLNYNLAKEAWNNVGVNPITEHDANIIHVSLFGPKIPKGIFDNNEKINSSS